MQEHCYGGVKYLTDHLDISSVEHTFIEPSGTDLHRVSTCTTSSAVTLLVLFQQNHPVVKSQ